MSAGGSSGPLRGGYWPLVFATQSVASPTTSAGITVGGWTVPTGARFVIHDVQAWSEYSGSAGASGGRGRINVFQGSTSVLSSEISLASAASTSGTLTAANVPVEAGVTITATAGAGFSGSTGATQHVIVTILGSLSQHPNSIYGNFGYANSTSQPAFGG